MTFQRTPSSLLLSAAVATLLLCQCSPPPSGRDGGGGGGGGGACGPHTCDGCCDLDGKCQAGNTLAACGKNGGVCDQCGTIDECVDGMCRVPTSPCRGQCQEGQVCIEATQKCCTPSCAGRVCGSDGCGGSCGTCASGACDEPTGQCEDDCFAALPDGGFPPEKIFAVAASAGPKASEGLTCNLDRMVGPPDNVYAGLAFAGSAGLDLPASVDGGTISVSSCVIADMGRTCPNDDRLGAWVEWRPARTTCGDPGGQSCEMPCGLPQGGALRFFAASDPSDPRYFLGSVQCGGPFDGGSGTLATITSPDTSDLPGIRYLVLCRPATNCGADDANTEIDSVSLFHYGYHFTLKATGMATYTGKTLNVVVREANASAKIAATLSGTIPSSGALTLSDKWVLRKGGSYTLSFYIDANNNGACDAPGTDPGWVRPITDVTTDVVVAFTYTGSFQDPCSAF